MDLKNYFNDTRGTGVLATAGQDGKVNAAIYSRPHIGDDGTAVFIMANKLTRSNLQENGSAVYLFQESGPGYRGCRLYLTKVKEEHNAALVEQICQRCKLHEPSGEAKDLAVVSFTIDQVLSLIGSGEVLDPTA
ncbi:MAG: pyridoxamine 5'-phosphate oxidase family protein [Deltaproteobacteria bacterium]|nr:pyridoxamine 5'-phosphate oxidase family protein [Candidatus Anaeroferrophillus wilburensis]MBN2887981.1 pyridoxamine 5'-phosphate oxidase family protein [Deltaproteobacteria bacterium]